MLLTEGREDGRGWVARRALTATVGPVAGMGGALTAVVADCVEDGPRGIAAAIGCGVGEIVGRVAGGGLAVALSVSLPPTATVSGFGAMHIKHLSSPQLLRYVHMSQPQSSCAGTGMTAGGDMGPDDTARCTGADDGRLGDADGGCIGGVLIASEGFEDGSCCVCCCMLPDRCRFGVSSREAADMRGEVGVDEEERSLLTGTDG